MIFPGGTFHRDNLSAPSSRQDGEQQNSAVEEGFFRLTPATFPLWLPLPSLATKWTQKVPRIYNHVLNRPQLVSILPTTFQQAHPLPFYLLLFPVLRRTFQRRACHVWLVIQKEAHYISFLLAVERKSPLPSYCVKGAYLWRGHQPHWYNPRHHFPMCKTFEQNEVKWSTCFFQITFSIVTGKDGV